jgi:hypothetical protein
LARFIGDGQDHIIVEEPIALMSILRYFEKEGYTFDNDVRERMQSAKGQAFEEAVLLSCTKLFRQGAHLDQVFQFHGTTSEWACQTASIVTKLNGTYKAFDIPNENPEVISASMPYITQDLKDVEHWMKSVHAGWCLLGPFMGPDLMAQLRLNYGQLLLVLIQAKCHLNGNLNTTAADVTAKAIRSVSPGNVFSELICATVHSLHSSLTIVYRDVQPPRKRSMTCLNRSMMGRIVSLERGTIFCVLLLITHWIPTLAPNRMKSRKQ